MGEDDAEARFDFFGGDHVNGVPGAAVDSWLLQVFVNHGIGGVVSQSYHGDRGVRGRVATPWPPKV